MPNKADQTPVTVFIENKLSKPDRTEISAVLESMHRVLSEYLDSIDSISQSIPANWRGRYPPKAGEQIKEIRQDIQNSRTHLSSIFGIFSKAIKSDSFPSDESECVLKWPTYLPNGFKQTQEHLNKIIISAAVIANNCVGISDENQRRAFFISSLTFELKAATFGAFRLIVPKHEENLIEIILKVITNVGDSHFLRRSPATNEMLRLISTQRVLNSGIVSSASNKMKGATPLKKNPSVADQAPEELSDEEKSEFRKEFMSANTPEEIGRLLKAARKRVRMTQVQVAEKMGTAEGAIRRIEAGSGDTKFTSITKYAAVVGIEIGVFH